MESPRSNYKSRSSQLVARSSFSPLAVRSRFSELVARSSFSHLMARSYIKMAWRNLFANKISAVINMLGLSVGMTVALLISFWVWDELSFNKYHENYQRIAQVMENDTYNGVVRTDQAIPLPLDAELRKSYGKDFEHIVLCTWTDPHTLTVGNKNISSAGDFMGSDGPEMFSLKMLKGTRTALTGPSSMLISQSVATALFDKEDPINQVIKLDNKVNFKVGGVYEDLPRNTTLHKVAFIAPWDFYANAREWIQRDPANWDDNSLFMFVQIAKNADMDKLSAKIKNVKIDHDPGEALVKPALFLQPMRKWHLYSEFKNGINTGGAIQYVWLFGIIGFFVLLLACINFMNLSTARSERRSKEVGIRKAIGSSRSQLITQFFCESLLIAILAFCFALFSTYLVLPFFNSVADKEMSIQWGSLMFWITVITFTLFTGFLSGSYPALYLSSFKPMKVLKGNFRIGRQAALPRKMLVVLQFTVSVVLIIGTIVIYKQIQFAKNRPIGYNRDGIVNIEVTTSDLHDHFDAVKSDLLKSGAITSIAESSSPATEVYNNRGGLEWQGKDPNMSDDFGNIAITGDYGKTLGWRVVQGKDFSNLPVDSLSLIINESAVKYMGFKNPIGQIVKVGRRKLTVIGVVSDMVMASAYAPVKQTIFYIGRGTFDNVIMKLNPAMSAHEALTQIGNVCKTYSPAVPFSYQFADDEYAKKFANEERVGILANFFSILAIFISALGLFGMAAFVAEQRTKEIGIRKVLGATVFNLWALLSKELVLLVLLSCLIAIPAAYFFMQQWLLNYDYRTTVPWWVFVGATTGALMITVLTVSFQSIKAALMNPVKSLRAE